MEKRGIDVSYHQGRIDWSKVASDFCIIRAGYGKSTIDKRFEENIRGCISRGIPVGVYWFIYAINTDDAIKNALKCVECLNGYKSSLTMKVWCDFEYDSDEYAKKHGYVLSKTSRSQIVKAFCDTMTQHGYDVGLYANPDYIRTKFDMSMLNYPLWLAQYSNQKSYDCYMWQYTSRGHMDGITGCVDMSILYDASGYPVPQRMLRRTNPMMRGEDVKWVQAHVGASVDGRYGDETTRLVKEYQRTHNLIVDGIVGPKTLAKMLQ